MISAAYAAGAAVHPLPFYSTPEFWVAMAFVLVVCFASRPVFRAAAAGLDARSAGIQAKLDEARALREDAQALLADYQRRQRDALKEAAAVLQHAHDEADRLKRDAEESLEALVLRREQRALERVKLAERAATAEIRDLAVDLAVRTAEKLVVRHLDDARADALIGDSIKALSLNLH